MATGPSAIEISPLFDAIESGAEDPSLIAEFLRLVRSPSPPLNVSDRDIRRVIIRDIGLADIYNTTITAAQRNALAFDTDLIHVQIRRRGRFTMLNSDGLPQIQQGAELLITASRAGAISRAEARSGEALELVVLHARPQTLAKKLGVSPALLPPALAQFFRPKPPGDVQPDIIEFHYVLPDKIGRALDDLLDNDLTPPALDLYDQAKIMECLIDCFALLQMPETLAAKNSFVSHNLRPFEQAREILLEHYRNPPNLDEIARAVGVSRRKLTAGFRQEYGTSPMNFALKLRMEEAQRLLKAGDIQIAQIAYRVGYHQPANFTQAFKNYFGYPPNEAAKRDSPSGDRK